MQNSKKSLFLIVFLIIVFHAKIFATASGVQISGNPGLLINEEGTKLENFTGRITGTIRLNRIPVATGFGLEAGKEDSDFAYGFYGFADYYAIDLQLKNTWNFYSGFGAEASFLTTDFKNWGITAGARFFAGMNWLFWDNFMELYIQQNVVPGYAKNLSDSDSKGVFILSLPFDAGIRFHF
ncbi:hypothetical protein [Treponema bryantii]|uniref:hypothetical protein n=1 Tax=Treponema bryantii TaxID=163 RepID=UPI002B2D2B21|nr:hypothetical protein TRBR_20260 [Treponema bryantii]